MQRCGPGPRSLYPTLEQAAHMTSIPLRRLADGVELRPVIVDTTWRRGNRRACLIIGLDRQQPLAVLALAITARRGLAACQLIYQSDLTILLEQAQAIRQRLCDEDWRAVDHRPPLSPARFFAALR
jgi:hypothetical protein